MRFSFLVPALDYPEAWDWAFDVQAEALRARGAIVDAVPWSEEPDLSAYDLVLPIVAWGYHLKYAQWRAFLDRVEAAHLPFVNPPALVRWNSDKTYLEKLAAKGVATVETIEVPSLDEAALAEAAARFGTDELVVKPAVSAAATGTHRLRVGDDLPPEERGLRMMIQPYLPSIAEEGEYGLIYFDGGFSHAVRKVPKQGDFRTQPHLGGAVVAYDPPQGGQELAQSALAAAPGKPTYARVDMVRGTEGRLQILELELIEPALFLDGKAQAQALFADALFRAVG